MESLVPLTSSVQSLGIPVLAALPPGLSPNEAGVCHNNLVAYLWESDGVSSQTLPSPLPLMAKKFALSPCLNLRIPSFTLTNPISHCEHNRHHRGQGAVQDIQSCLCQLFVFHDLMFELFFCCSDKNK